MDRFPRSDSIVQPRAGLQTYMAQVYGWMTVGLLLTTSRDVLETLGTDKQPSDVLVFGESAGGRVSVPGVLYCEFSGSDRMGEE